MRPNVHTLKQAVMNLLVIGNNIFFAQQDFCIYCNKSTIKMTCNFFIKF